MLKKLSDDRKVFVVIVTAAIVIFTAGVAITVSALTIDRDKEALEYVNDNFGELVGAHITGIEMSPVLSAMLRDVNNVSVSFGENKQAVNVRFTLPEMDMFQAVEAVGTFPDANTKDAEQIDPFQFISEFERGYLKISQTSNTRSYSVNLPISFSRFNLELDLYSRDFMEIVESYSGEFSEKLDALITKTNLGDALSAYFFSNDESADDIAAQRLSPFLSSAVVSYSVGDYGILYMELERFDSSGLVDYVLNEQLGAYEGVFLTEAIAEEAPEAEFLQQLNTYTDRLRGADGERPDGGEKDIPAGTIKERSIIELGSISAAGEEAKASFIPGLTSYNYEYAAAVSALNEAVQALPVFTAQPEPMSSILTGNASGLTFRIENPAGFGACFIEFLANPQDIPFGAVDGDLEYYGNDGYLGVYVRAGENFEVRLPPGVYMIEYSFGSGNSWYGVEYLFGPDGMYALSADMVTLDDGAYILTLNTDNDLGEAVDKISVPYSSRVSLGSGDDNIDGSSFDLDVTALSETIAPAEGTTTRLQRIEAPQSTRRALAPAPEQSSEELPYLIYVSKNSFTIAILGLGDDGEYTELLYTFHTAVGRTNALTRPGNYTITSRERWHRWASGNQSPFATKHSGGLFFHGPAFSARNPNALIIKSYNEIGTRATSGCMRTTTAGAAWIYFNCPNGTPVIIANDSKYTSELPERLEAWQTYDPSDPDAMRE